MSEFDHEIAGLPPATSSDLLIHQPVLSNEDDLLTVGDDFDLDNFQVVRREFFAHIHEPSITFSEGKIVVNAACLSKFPTVDYVQLIINRETKVLGLRPCAESARDSFPWCTLSKGKRRPRQTTGRIFSAMLFTLMDWNPDYRYKLLGKVVYAKGEYLVAFDLTATEVYQRSVSGSGKLKATRTPVFPAHWQSQFGMPLKEHNRSLQISVFDGYAVFAVRDKSQIRTQAIPTHPTGSDDLADSGMSSSENPPGGAQ